MTIKDKMCCDLQASTEQCICPGGRFGKEGTNTPPAPGAVLARTVTMPDGYTSVAPDDMYRIDELEPGRREPCFPNLHNLHDTVFERTLNPPKPTEDEHNRRAMLWDLASEAVLEALKEVPSGTHVNVCANSGPHNPKLENLPPWTTVPGASVGLLMVAEFRDEKATGIHPGWRQVAHPIRSDEGRLLAGLRLLATVCILSSQFSATEHTTDSNI